MLQAVENGASVNPDVRLQWRMSKPSGPSDAKQAPKADKSGKKRKASQPSQAKPEGPEAPPASNPLLAGFVGALEAARCRLQPSEVSLGGGLAHVRVNVR